MSRQHPWQGLALILICIACASCGHRPDPVINPVEGGGEEGVQLLRFPTEIIVRVDGEDRQLIDEELFDIAKAKLDEGDHKDCARLFDVLWRALEEPTYELWVPSLYNAGLCYERGKQFARAGDRYQRLIDEVYHTRDGIDAVFRLAEVHIHQQKWREIEDNMTHVLGHEALRHSDMVEAHYRKGMSQLAQHRALDAEKTFKACIKRNRGGARAMLSNRHHLIAGCLYGQALVFHNLFDTMKFTPKSPSEPMTKTRMKEVMERKKELAREAHNKYIKTIRTKNKYWAMLSGYMVGKLYEDFYYDILTAEIPTTLDNEDKLRGYFDELRAQLKPLIGEAVGVYRKTLVVSERIGIDNEWIEATEARLEHLQRYADDSTLHRREEELIIELQRKRREGINVEELEPLMDALEDLRPLPAAPHVLHPK